MRQADRAGHPVRPPLIRSEDQVPIEVLGTRLEGHGDVAQPQGSRNPVPQQMQAEETKMVLRSEHPHLDPAEGHQLRPRVRVLPAARVEVLESAVQIDRRELPASSRQERQRRHRTGPGARRGPGRRTAAGRARDTGERSTGPLTSTGSMPAIAQAGDDARETGGVQGRLQSVILIGAAQPFAGGGRPQRRLADAPPGEGPGLRPQETQA